MKVLFLLLCTLEISALAELTMERACALEIKRHARRTLIDGRSPLILPPYTKRLLIGALVQTRTKELVLAIGGYRMNHHNLDEALEIARDSEGLQDFTYEWMGELLIGNDTPYRSIGRILAANETAGFWAEHGARLGARHRNRVALLRSRIEGHFPSFLGIGATWLTFNQSQRTNRLHLCDQTTAYQAVFEDARERGLIAPRETIRHYISNKTAGLFAYLETMTMYQTLDPSLVESAREMMRTGLALESAQLFLEWLRNDGIEVERTKEVLDWLAKIRFRDLSDAEWGEFAEVAGPLGTIVNSVMKDDGMTGDTHVLYLDPR